MDIGKIAQLANDEFHAQAKCVYHQDLTGPATQNHLKVDDIGAGDFVFVDSSVSGSNPEHSYTPGGLLLSVERPVASGNMGSWAAARVEHSAPGRVSARRGVRAASPGSAQLTVRCGSLRPVPSHEHRQPVDRGDEPVQTGGGASESTGHHPQSEPAADRSGTPGQDRRSAASVRLLSCARGRPDCRARCREGVAVRRQQGGGFDRVQFPEPRRVNQDLRRTCRDRDRERNPLQSRPCICSGFRSGLRRPESASADPELRMRRAHGVAGMRNACVG
jgi:hypothetical protein